MLVGIELELSKESQMEEMGPGYDYISLCVYMILSKNIF